LRGRLDPGHAGLLVSGARADRNEQEARRVTHVITLEPDPSDDQSPRAWPEATLSVDAGRMLVLTGPPGCGKSRLLRAAAGLEPARGARVGIAGLHLESLSHRQRRKVAARMRLFY